MSDDIEEAEVVEEGNALAVRHDPGLNLFGSDNPNSVIERATEHATALAQVIQSKELYSNISGKQHVRVEGWTLLGSMLGVFPVTVWTKKLENGWAARVEARTLSGAVVGAAEAQCLRSESNWKSRDEYALQSMAQTRATSKALRQPLGFVMTLAGYEATPAEEIPHEEQERLTCPGCGQPSVERVRSDKKTAPKWACRNDGCSGGKDGRTWASWDENEFGDGAVTRPSAAAPSPPAWFADHEADEIVKVAQALIKERDIHQTVWSVENLYDAPEHFLADVQQRLETTGGGADDAQTDSPNEAGTDAGSPASKPKQGALT